MFCVTESGGPQPVRPTHSIALRRDLDDRGVLRVFQEADMTQAFALRPDEGVTRTVPVKRVEKITAEESGGWAVAVETCPPGLEVAPHIHRTEDGAFFILQGSLHMQVGDLQVEATPGTFVFMPRGVLHSFAVTSTRSAIYLNIQGPTGDFQKLMAETDQLLRSSLPREETSARAAALAIKYGLEVLPT
jgi:mannose-6-phosphate isomerase-like protein (cupin superfamily)